MRHVTFADKSLLLGDDATATLLEYAAELGKRGQADTVTVNAISSDGDDVEAEFLLNSGSPLMAESSTTQVEEPDNSEAIAYMSRRIQLLTRPPNVLSEQQGTGLDFDHPAAFDG